jgi:hypothetical protein
MTPMATGSSTDGNSRAVGHTHRSIATSCRTYAMGAEPAEGSACPDRLYADAGLPGGAATLFHMGVAQHIYLLDPPLRECWATLSGRAQGCISTSMQAIRPDLYGRRSVVCADNFAYAERYHRGVNARGGRDSRRRQCPWLGSQEFGTVG